MARRLWGALLAASLTAASGPAGGQTAPKPATDVAPVIVTGRRPSAEQARSAACVEAMRDPQARALLASGAMTLYGRTRPPRNPDYSAPPTVPLDAPLPDVDIDAGAGAAPDSGVEDGDARALTLAAAVAECARRGRSRRPSDGPGRVASGERGSQLFWSRLAGPRSVPGSRLPALPRNNSSAFGSFRAGSRPIAKPDQTLPLAFALFDQGRYRLALDAFVAAQKKLADVDGGDEASLMIGKIFLHVSGERGDPVEAVKWLKWASSSYFNPTRDIQPFDPKRPEYTTAIGEASMILAGLYANGHGPIAKDPQAARKYLERAVATGYVPASKQLGDIYYQGVDTPRDLKKAFRHYMDAATYAYAPAAVMVARMYAAGEAPGGVNLTLAAAWNNEAAKFDDPEALYAMAAAYDHGEGVPPDPERALGFYKVSAAAGYAPAQAAIGAYFYTGEQVPRDLEVARGWFEQAAMGADPDGMFNLAAMMARGEGGEVDRVSAWGWLKIAESQGHPGASAAIQALEAQFTAADRAGVEQLARADETVQPPGPATDPEGDIDSAFVGAAPGGPPWWKVSKGKATVWILGLPPGVTPQTQRWNTAPLRRILDGARLVIAPYSPWERVGLDNTPWDPLPKPLGAKVTAAAVLIRKPPRNRTPTFSDAVRTYENWLQRARLRDAAPDALLWQVMVKERVRLATPPRQPGPSLASIYPADPEVAACVEAMLQDMATPPDAWKAAGEAWAAGDVAGALAGARRVEWSCRMLWPDYWERTVGFQTEAIAMALDMPGKVVVAGDIGQLVARGGILPRLRAMGLEVSGPMQPTER